mgnify:CR=1 FL=1
MTKQTIALQLDLPSVPNPQTAAFLELGTGETILLLHGFMGNATCWLPLLEHLQTQLRCVAIDLLGFGDSAKPALKYNIAQEVAFVRRFVEARQLDNFYIMGHSFGGWVAAAYALAFPKSVQGLILAAPAGIRDDSFCGRYDHLRPILWDTPAIDWLLTLATPFVTLTGQAETLQKIRWMRRELMAQPAARSFLMDRLRPEDAIDTVETQIYQLRVPTLVITGDQDETIPLWHSQTYAQVIPTAKLVILPNADHSLPQNHAPQLAEHIRQFLQEKDHSTQPNSVAT